MFVKKIVQSLFSVFLKLSPKFQSPSPYSVVVQLASLLEFEEEVILKMFTIFFQLVYHVYEFIKYRSSKTELLQRIAELPFGLNNAPMNLRLLLSKVLSEVTKIN